ncbi:hypothetical protein AZE42_04169 [Rhizopogon vesiculosus]|uniref:Thioesterase domain-containing protein n=1 Tax=Rhizopogon vesiculosus TaxID=180088 RepID=A0A1J8QBR2_9AGAM|nr:hypothetical protein AZE42_04169 [Rhizopogon vesiculosus]
MPEGGDTDISQVEGNTSPEIKRAVLGRVQYLAARHVTQSTGEQFGTFENKIASRLRLTEVSMLPKAEEPEKLEGRVVFEVIADGEMANRVGTLHGGTAAMLIDEHVSSHMMPESGDTDISQVEGNASPEMKRELLGWVQYLATRRVTQSIGDQFGAFENKIASRLRLTEVSILPKAEEPEKLEGRVVFEYEALLEMANHIGTLYGGVAAMLIDQHVSSTHMMPESGDTDISQVEGNASPELKRAMLGGTVQYLATRHVTQSTGEQFGAFENKIASRLQVTEVSILPKAEEPEKLEGRVVVEVIADGEMANHVGTLHGGVAAMLIDMHVPSTHVRLQPELISRYAAVHRCPFIFLGSRQAVVAQSAYRNL